MDKWNLDIPWTVIESDNSKTPDMADVSAVKRKWLNVPYGAQSPSQVLDIYLPAEGDGPFPVYLFIHGGGFIAGDKQDVQFLLAADGINRGYAVVSVEYRRAFESKAPNALYDIKSAIRFVRAHAGEYHLDPFRFALGGDSAGAYFAVFAAATAGIEAFDGPDPTLPGVSSEVACVVAQCGCYNLLAMAPPPAVEAAATNVLIPGTLPLHLMTFFFGVNPHLIPDLAALLNPLRYITKTFPNILVQVGTKDAVVPWTESKMLADVIEQRCGEGRAVLQTFDGWNHAALNKILTPDWFMDANMQRVFGFLDRNM